MKTIKEEIKVITLYDRPETKEALRLIEYKRIQQAQQTSILKWIMLASAGLILLSILINLVECVYFFLGIILICSFVMIGLKIHHNKQLKPYKELYKIAVHNDQIRNDEHIRFKERKRLEELEIQKNKQTSLQKIEDTINKLNIQTTNDKNIDKEIKSEIKKLPPKPPVNKG